MNLIVPTVYSTVCNSCKGKNQNEKPKNGKEIILFKGVGLCIEHDNWNYNNRQMMWIGNLQGQCHEKSDARERSESTTVANWLKYFVPSFWYHKYDIHFIEVRLQWVISITM